jgi:hypothetical protein
MRIASMSVVTVVGPPILTMCNLDMHLGSCTQTQQGQRQHTRVGRHAAPMEQGRQLAAHQRCPCPASVVLLSHRHLRLQTGGQLRRQAASQWARRARGRCQHLHAPAPASSLQPGETSSHSHRCQPPNNPQEHSRICTCPLPPTSVFQLACVLCPLSRLSFSLSLRS